MSANESPVSLWKMLPRALVYLSLIDLFVACEPLGAAIKQVSPAVVVTRELGSVDFLSAKTAIDRIVDPSIRAAEVEGQTGKLIAAARAFAGPQASEGAKFDGLFQQTHPKGPQIA